MTIKLENVSIRDMIYYPNGFLIKSNDAKIISELFSKYNIKNYQELQDFLGRDDVKIEHEILLKLRYAIAITKEKIASINVTGNVPELFTFDLLESIDIDDNAKQITDHSNNCNILPYSMPYAYGTVLNKLKYITIAEAKQLLSTAYIDGSKIQNAFTGRRNIGPTTAKRVASLIDFYDEQVARQALTHKEASNCDLFNLNKEAKIEIVTEQLKEIIEYLLNTADECIFGQLSDMAKTKIASASISEWGRETLRTKMNLIELIANYTTLTELETGVLKDKEIITPTGHVKVRKPIDRLIVTKR